MNLADRAPTAPFCFSETAEPEHVQPLTLERATKDYAPLVHSLAWRFARNGVLDVDDLIQEGFLALLAAFAAWRVGGCGFGTFAGLRIRSRLVRTIARARRRGITLTPGVRKLSIEHSDLDAPIGSTNDTLHDLIGAHDSDELERRQAISSVADALARMPLEERRLLTTWADDGMTQAETAARLGVQVKAFHERYARALAKLARMLNCEVAPRVSRKSRVIEFEGTTKTAAEWARHLGLDRKTLTQRLAGGWSIADALTTPATKNNKKGGPSTSARLAA